MTTNQKHLTAERNARINRYLGQAAARRKAPTRPCREASKLEVVQAQAPDPAAYNGDESLMLLEHDRARMRDRMRRQRRG